MGLETWFINRKLKGVYNRMSNDRKATVLGFVLSGLQAANVDYGRAINLEPAEIGKLVGALVTAVLCWYINKPDKAAEPKG